MSKYIVIINKKHQLFEQQDILLGGDGNYMRIELPEKSATIGQITEIYRQIETMHKSGYIVVVVSPLTALLALISRHDIPYRVMFNEKRDQKIVTKPDGKNVMLQVAPSDGWMLF